MMKTSRRFSQSLFSARTRKLGAIVLLLVCLFALLIPTEVLAAGNTKSNRQTVMDFEGDLVEGVNKRPWDSLSQISDKNARRRAHLYQKRKGFRTENRETLQELRYQR